MSLFNHQLRVENIEDEIDGSKSFLINLIYDDAFGIKRNCSISVDADNISDIKVGGTATSDISVKEAVVINRLSHDKAVLLFNSQIQECSTCQPVDIGDKVLVFEHMQHESGSFGKFNLLATKIPAIDFKLNSIRIICCNKNGDEVKVVYIDPYIGYVGYGYNT